MVNHNPRVFSNAGLWQVTLSIARSLVLQNNDLSISIDSVA